ncbi:MAG TPA: hypothetical protein V6C76_12430 [Drouetiella sp.]
MNSSLRRIAISGLVASILTCAYARDSFAQYNPSWAEQQARNAQRQQAALADQAARGYSPNRSSSPDALQRERWEAEWRQQHPGEPMPNPGQMQKLHQGEIMNNMNRGFNQMRANRQAELQRNYQMLRQHQAQENAARGITWSPQQWQAWDRQYDGAQRQAAQDYLNGVKQAGEMWHQQDEDRKRREIYSPYGN